MNEVSQALKQYILREFMFDRDDSSLDDDLPLIQEGIVDSLGIFILVNFIDERFGVKIRPEEIIFDNFWSVKAIAGLVNRRQQETSS